MLFVILFLTPIIAAGQSFSCTPERVWDADGPIWCEEGPRVRLHGIAAREMDGTCSAGHPCPTMMPLEARRALIELLAPESTSELPKGHIATYGARSLTCMSFGSAGGKRTAAVCLTPDGIDLSCELVRAGAALDWPKYSHGEYARCVP